MQVVVMDKGAVAEVDAPFLLLQNRKSIFYGMCLRSGDLDGIYETAKAAYEAKPSPQVASNDLGVCGGSPSSSSSSMSLKLPP